VGKINNSYYVLIAWGLSIKLVNEYEYGEEECNEIY